MTKASLDPSTPFSRSFAQARRVSKDITWLFGRVKSLVYQQQWWAPGNLSNISGIQDTGNGFWNDMDMMEIGNAGVGAYQGIWQNLSYAESRTHFALWSLLKSPMLLGCDLTAQRADILDVLSNGEATAFNQDPLGIQATLVSSAVAKADEAYMVLQPCNSSEQRQLGWKMYNGTVRAQTSAAASRGDQDMCITAAHPMYDAVLLPCDDGDARQQWLYNSTSGELVSAVVYTAAQPVCLASSFAHELRGNFVSVAICRSNGPQWTLANDGTLSDSRSSQTAHAVAKNEKDCVARVDQTPLEQAIGVGQLQVYGGRLAGGAYGVGLSNMDTVRARNVTVHFADLGIVPGAAMQVRDVWAKQNLSNHEGSLTVEVNPHDTVLLRLSPL